MTHSLGARVFLLTSRELFRSTSLCLSIDGCLDSTLQTEWTTSEISTVPQGEKYLETPYLIKDCCQNILKTPQTQE